MNVAISPEIIRGELQQQYDVANMLLRILEQEYIALSGNDLHSLETFLAGKQHCMEKLENISQAFLAKTVQFSLDQKPGIGAFLAQCDPQSKWNLESLWQQVEQSISQCRQKNNINGKIISLNYRHTQRALAILRHGGQVSESCYTPSGTSQPANSSRILGKV